MTATSQLNRERIGQFIGSCFFVGIGLLTILAACAKQKISIFLPSFIFACYLIGTALIIVVIVGRLYAQHEIRRIRFDLANLFLLTALVSLPFAVANILWSLLELNAIDEISNYRPWIQLSIAGVFFFLMLPVFFITEALLFWWLQVSRRSTK